MKRGSANFSRVTGRSRFFIPSLLIIFGMGVGLFLPNAHSLFFSRSKPTTSVSVDALQGTTALRDVSSEGAQTQNDSDESVTTSKPTQSLPNNLEQILAAIFNALPSSATSKEQANLSEKVNLGRLLFYDPSLSVNGTVSCNHCHDLQTYGVDGLPRSVGVTEIATSRNTPTVYNAAIQKAQFWDGRSPTLEDQATMPILAEHEMGMIHAENVETRLKSNTIYPQLFELAFPDDPNPVTLKNVGIAIAAFERGLLTPSRFDKFLTGDYSQLNEQEIRGLNTFISLRCNICHNGAGVGGASFTRLGIAEPYETEDVGRFAITNKEEDKFVFKVSSLRNVAQTAPYLHDGSVDSLAEVVRLMARYQLGKSVTDQEVDDVVAFLDSLTGEIPSDYITPPELP